MTTISLKIPKLLLRDVEAEARRRGVSKSAVIRRAVEEKLQSRRARKGRTCLELMGELVGSISGPRDLSTNPRYLEEAIMADHHRARKRSH